MRDLQYLSPTSIATWEKDVEEFYLNYLSENRPPRFPQTLPMSIGSAFDAYAKSFIHEALFGKDNNPKYNFEALFEAQVEVQNRDWAREHGKYVFEQYRSAGALADLMLELRNAQGEPRFEFEVRGAVHGYKEAEKIRIAEVVLLGKPDVTYTNAAGYHVILDFKVNGYCSNTPPYPLPGYLKLRSAGKTQHGMHKQCQPMMVNGSMVNIARHLEDIQKTWARQLAVYAWLCGDPVGSDFIVQIDQIVCDKTKGVLPQIRIAEHRYTISKKFQQEEFAFACNIWEIVKSGWIFRNMSEDESRKRCAVLDQIKDALTGEGTSEDHWFAAACRG